MCGSYEDMKKFKINFLKQEWAKAAKQIEGYHIHIYHNDGKSFLSARETAESIQDLFEGDVRGVSSIGAVGPHLTPNFGVYIKPEAYGRVVQWLQANSDGLSILIHPETGDDVKDHLKSSMWLGTQLGYNDKFF